MFTAVQEVNPGKVYLLVNGGYLSVKKNMYNCTLVLHLSVPTIKLCMSFGYLPVIRTAHHPINANSMVTIDNPNRQIPCGMRT